MKVIDSNELKEWVKNWFEKHHYYHPYSKADNIPITELYDLLEQMPEADVELVRHGQLLDAHPYGICSLCGFLIDSRENFNYCPNCGAKMDGGADDE